MPLTPPAWHALFLRSKDRRHFRCQLITVTLCDGGGGSNQLLILLQDHNVGQRIALGIKLPSVLYRGRMTQVKRPCSPPSASDLVKRGIR